LLKVRDNLPAGDYSDPGWYQPPPGSMAALVSSDPDFGNSARRKA